MTDAHASITVKGFKIAEELFTTGFKAGQGPFNCTSRCCHRGAYMDVAEREVLIHLFGEDGYAEVDAEYQRRKQVRRAT